MIQVNRIYLIFNRLVTKKFLVDTSVQVIVLIPLFKSLVKFPLESQVYSFACFTPSLNWKPSLQAEVVTFSRKRLVSVPMIVVLSQVVLAFKLILPLDLHYPTWRQYFHYSEHPIKKQRISTSAVIKLLQKYYSIICSLF